MCERFLVYKLDVHDLVAMTNKMQPCVTIYYSTVHWRLDMFQAAYRSSSGALTVLAASGLHTRVVTGRSEVWVRTDVHKSVHHDIIMNTTNEMQLRRFIYYS
jgi:hypothetical protein